MFREPPDYECAIISDAATDYGEQIHAAVSWLACAPSQLTVVTPGVRNLDYQPRVKDLLSRGASGMSVRQLGHVRGPVLALWLDDKGMAEVEQAQPTRVALVAGSHEPVIWIQSRHPIDLSAGERTAGVSMDPVVAVAMQAVADVSNPANGCTGYNRAAAVQAFRELRKRRHRWEPDAVASLMAEAGWDLRAADEFRHLASDMLAGRSKQLGAYGEQFRSDIYRLWVEEAQRVGNDGGP